MPVTVVTQDLCYLIIFLYFIYNYIIIIIFLKINIILDVFYRYNKGSFCE